MVYYVYIIHNTGCINQLMIYNFRNILYPVLLKGQIVEFLQIPISPWSTSEEATFLIPGWKVFYRRMGITTTISHYTLYKQFLEK